MRALIVTGMIGAGIISGLGATAMATAGPASAGCQGASVGFFGGGQRCDGPVDNMGNYTRCESGHGFGFGGSNCYTLHVSQSPRIPG